LIEADGQACLNAAKTTQAVSALPGACARRRHNPRLPELKYRLSWTSFGLSMAGNTAASVVKEFLPDLFRLIAPD